MKNLGSLFFFILTTIGIFYFNSIPVLPAATGWIASIVIVAGASTFFYITKDQRRARIRRAPVNPLTSRQQMILYFVYVFLALAVVAGICSAPMSRNQNSKSPTNVQ